MRLAVSFHPVASALIAMTTFSRAAEAQSCPVMAEDSSSFGGFSKVVVDLDCEGVQGIFQFPASFNWHITEVEGLGESKITMVPPTVVSPYVSNGALMFTYGSGFGDNVTEAG